MKMLKLPKEVEEELKIENKQLNRVIKDCEQEYFGTHPVKDAKRLYRDLWKSRHGLKSEEEQKFEVMSQKKYDPFDDFGHGIKAYFRLLKIMMNLFLALTVVFIPVMIIYLTGGEFRETDNYMWSAITLGNFGFTESHCYFWYADLPNGNFFPKCNSGKIKGLKYYGLASTFVKKETKYAKNFCGDHKDSPMIETCTKAHFKGKEIERDFTEKCVGK